MTDNVYFSHHLLVQHCSGAKGCKQIPYANSEETSYNLSFHLVSSFIDYGSSLRNFHSFEILYENGRKPDQRVLIFNALHMVYIFES